LGCLTPITAHLNKLRQLGSVVFTSNLALTSLFSKRGSRMRKVTRGVTCLKLLSLEEEKGGRKRG